MASSTAKSSSAAAPASHKAGEQRGPPPTPPMYQEWAAQVQAFYTHAAASSTAATATPQPYVWGAQTTIPPFGTAIYTPVYFQGGGASAHQSVTVAAGPAYQAADPEKNAATTAQGDDAAVKGKSGDEDEDVDDASESESEGSSEARGGRGSSEPKEAPESRKRNLSERQSDSNHTGSSYHAAPTAPSSGATGESLYSGRGTGKLPVSAPGRVVLPSANLNIGAEVWSSTHAEDGTKVQHNMVGSAPANAASAVLGRKGVVPEQWMDDRELKRQKRKQSNRESARRSRLRKQQECEDLARRVDELSNENNALREELEQLNKDCKDLASENTSILEELTQLYGPGVLSSLEGIDGGSTSIQSVDDRSTA